MGEEWNENGQGLDDGNGKVKWDGGNSGRCFECEGADESRRMIRFGDWLTADQSR